MAPRLLIADPIRLSRFVSVGRKPPGPAELDGLRRQGFRAVLDLRQETEHTGPLAPEAEAAAASSRGLEYTRIPISSSAADDALLDRVDQALKQLPKPLFVHCASGRRAGMAALAHIAIEQGMSGESMLDSARHLDVLYGTRSQQRWFADYVDRRQKEADAGAPLAGTAQPGSDPAPPVTPPFAPIPGEHLSEHAQTQAIRSTSHGPPAHRVIGVMLAGTVLAAVVDRRLSLLPLLGLGFLARHRAAAFAQGAARHIRTTREADAEIAALSGRLRSLTKPH